MSLFLGQPHEFCPQKQHLLLSTTRPYNAQKCLVKLEQNFFIATVKCSVSLGYNDTGRVRGPVTEQRAQGETPSWAASPFTLIPCDPPEQISPCRVKISGTGEGNKQANSWEQNSRSNMTQKSLKKHENECSHPWMKSSDFSAAFLWKESWNRPYLEKQELD